jgi:hypothetical protein
MNSLFPELENEHEKEWKDMPEFLSEKNNPFQQIKVSFKSFDDVKEFGKLLGIKNITPKTDSLWFPKKDTQDKFIYASKLWKDEK